MKYDKNKLFKNHMNKKEKKTTFFLLKLSYKTDYPGKVFFHQFPSHKRRRDNRLDPKQITRKINKWKTKLAPQDFRKKKDTDCFYSHRLLNKTQLHLKWTFFTDPAAPPHLRTDAVRYLQEWQRPVTLLRSLMEFSGLLLHVAAVGSVSCAATCSTC